MTASKNIREKAHSILQMTGIKEPPVDVNMVSDRLGFRVIPFDFPDDTSAVLLIEGKVRSIGVNSRHGIVRQRFSVAHELGHYLSGHEDFSGEHHLKIEGRPIYEDPEYRQELEANEFAAELLMPRFILKKDVQEIGLDITALAQKYKVSEQAMWIQLINLGFADEYGKP
jgi:Zn-dependent peptidase ImmA (M78 family)